MHRTKLHVRPRRASGEDGSTYYVSSAHKRAWRYAPAAKLAFVAWGVMAEILGALALVVGILLFAVLAVAVPLVLWF